MSFVPLNKSGWKGMNQGGKKSTTQQVSAEAFERIFGKKEKQEYKPGECKHNKEKWEFKNGGNEIPRRVLVCQECGRERELPTEGGNEQEAF